MSETGAPLVGSYDLSLVVLSFFIAILASFVGLDLAIRVKASRERARWAWWAGGSISVGLGIWSMHFVGMLAFDLPIPVRYNVLTVLFSLLAAVLAAAFALYVVSGERLRRRDALFGSLVMGGGIAAMHYVGMAAMRLPATCQYNPLLLGLSIVIAIVASLAALTFAFDFHEEHQATWAKGTAAAMMGVAIASMHYTGMAAASFKASNVTLDFSHSLSVSWLGIAGILVVTLLTLGFTLLTIFMGRQFDAQSLRLQLGEQLLRQSRSVIDAIPQQIWSGPPDGTLDYANERWRSYMGLGLEELRGDGWQAMLHPDDRDRVLKAWQESITNGTPYEQEERHRGSDDIYRWFLARGTALRDSEGRIVRWYGTNTDIEDLKRAEEALRSSEREQRHITAQLERDRSRLVEAQAVAKMGSWEADLQSFNVIWSEQTHCIFETDPSHFHPTRSKFLEFIQPEDRAKVDAAFVASLDKRSPTTVDYRIVMPDGRVKILEERWHVFCDEGGKPVRVAGTCRDITERVRADDDLQRLSRQLLRSQDEERRRIARDLHDSTGQNFVALATALGRLRASFPLVDQQSHRLLAECRDLAEGCIREVRTLSYVLHPPVLDEFTQHELRGV